MPLQIRGSSQILNSTISLSKLDNQGGTIAGNLTLSGDSITVNNDLETQSTTNLGDSSDDTTTCSGTLSANAIENTPIGSLTKSTGAFTTISSSGVSTLNSLTVSNDGSIGGNLTVDGNIIISGTSVQMDVSGFKTEDSMFQLSKGNSSNLIDIGFFAKTRGEDPDLDPKNYSSIRSPSTLPEDSEFFGTSYWSGVIPEQFATPMDVSDDGKVLATYSRQKTYYSNSWRYLHKVHVYDWNESGRYWEWRNAIQLEDNDLGTNETVQTIKMSQNGDLLLIICEDEVYYYEWKDTDNDNVKDSWNLIQNFYVASAGNQYTHGDVKVKPNGDVIRVLAQMFYPYSNTNSASTHKGRITTAIKYSGNSGFTSISTATFDGDSGGSRFGSGGICLSSDGTVLAVSSVYGTPQNNYSPGNYSDGFVNIYTWDSINEEWDLQDTIVDPTYGTSDQGTNVFGSRPSLNSDGTKIAIGATNQSFDSARGKIYFYKYNSTSGEWESDSDYSSIRGEPSNFASQSGITSDFSKISVGTSLYNYEYSDEYNDYPDIFPGIIKTYIYNSGDSSWNEIYHPDYVIDKFSGLIRDADDSGKFKLFSTEENIPSTSTVNFVGTDTETLLATIEGNVTGNLTGNVTGNSSTMSKLQTPRTISLGEDLSGSVSFDGSGDVTLNATIVNGSIQLSNIDFFVDEDDLGGLSSSDVKVPSQQSVKKYVDDRVSDGGYTELETKDIKMVNSDGDFVKTKKIFQTSLIGSSDITNGYVSLSTNVETQFEHLSSVFLNGIKLRFGTSTQVSNSQRDYYFDDTTKNKIYFSSDIITQNDKLEIRYFVLS